MAVKAGDPERDLIQSLGAAVSERLADQPPAAYAEFVRQYYHWVPTKDLTDRGPEELGGAVVSHWRTARRRARGEAKVEVFNPDPERDGWSSSYTVLQIVADDMPFMVDSVTMELSRLGYAIELIVHPVMRVVRDDVGELTEVLEPGAVAYGFVTESVIHAEVARERDPLGLDELRAGIRRVLAEVRAAVEDWPAMRARTTELATDLRRQAPPIDTYELDESEAFIAWLADGSFIFLGYREYELHPDDAGAELTAVEGSGLGILRGPPLTPATRLKERQLELACSPHPLVLAKTNSRATVHRPSHLDYVGVKRFSPAGEVVGECRFLGLYTHLVYKTSPLSTPILRGKVQAVMDRAAFPPDSHDAKGLIDILEELPRDLLLQIDTDDLFEIAIGILGLGERQRVRLFICRDRLERFVWCTLCLPRDRFNTENRLRAGRILEQAFGGDQIDWRLTLTESLIVRVHYVVHCPNGIPADTDAVAIEARIAEATRAWTDDLRAALLAEHGELEGLASYARYQGAFPPSYRADRDATAAVADIERIDQVRATGRPIVTVYRRPGEPEHMIRCQLVSASGVSLSDVVPTFEHMGATVLDERPYEVAPADGEPVWIYDIGLSSDPATMSRAGEAFADVFLSVWSGAVEDDRLNALAISAALTARQVTVIRAVLSYLRQAMIAFSDSYMSATLLANHAIAASLVRLFEARFDPDTRDPGRAEELRVEIETAIDAVASLDEDRILRRCLEVVMAMLRTNHFCHDERGDRLPYLSFKLDPSQLPVLPLPRPRFEIFVYSTRVEGVHLRGGKVARGGVRWSDRREDFRTEVLGLMKAQMVKNAMIVPVGSKGGFVVKRPPDTGGREAQLREGIECYRTFLCGLLDLTDNYVGAEVVPPPRVVRYDDDDPYLVVAADKGTASFSDIANRISASYGFWLGDAFASGGSHGYDHKAMGITARGAWESVKRHFRELGTDVQEERFTVVGIGDMSGDVFGNGMLCSPQTRLVAAFNHMHIFLDPDPDPQVSLRERRRLFELARSSWSDYNPALISEGGGVHLRSAKSVELTPQVRDALGIEAERLSPAQLIRELLRAPVDLLFNGGIGTYVKAASETPADAGDRANDAVRVDGAELRCRVVAEGGNLGLTQRGRIEYALSGGPEGRGGRINTDAIDNVAGVNCSDHEVNIKILLADAIASGEMDEEDRNPLLIRMTDAVAEQVLYGSYVQSQAMSLALRQSPSTLDTQARLIRMLGLRGAIDRELECLPSEAALETRQAERRGLVSPEIAVLLAYCKIHLHEQLIESDLPEDPYFAGDLERYFPPPLGERHPERIRGHRLRRELIATIAANQLVDRAGPTFAFRLIEESGASVPEVARAFAVARDVYELREFWAAVEKLDNRIDAGTQLAMLIDGADLAERGARWLLGTRGRGPVDVTETVARFAPGAQLLARAMPGVLRGGDREAYDARLAELTAAGVPPVLAQRVASMQTLGSAFDVVVDAEATGVEPAVVAATHFGLGARLGIDWLRERIVELPRSGRWQSLARSALREDLFALHSALTRDVLHDGASEGSERAIERWVERNAVAVRRSEGVLEDVRASHAYDTTTLPVALRELRSLVPVSAQAG